MIKYKIYQLYPGFEDRLVIPNEWILRELFDNIDEAIEVIRLHGAKQEYAIITIFKKE